LSFGAAEEESVSSTMPDMGGLVARGDGTAGKPNEEVEGPRLKPRLGKFGVAGGGLVADVEGVAGAVPLLNSAHRGHLRFVSAVKIIGKVRNNKASNLLMCPICPQWPHRLCLRYYIFSKRSRDV
jgi:hypothetical protein